MPSQRMRLPPISSVSLSASPRGGRSARSPIEIPQPSWPWTIWACGAAANQRFMAPHSSASTWPKLIQRSRSSGITLDSAALISGNIWRCPQWNSMGSSASIRNWLKVKPAGGATSGVHVDRR